MQLRMDRDALLSALQYTGPVVPARPTEPVYAGISVRAADGVVTLSAQDPNSRVFARSSFSAETVEDGEVVVSGRLLVDIVKSLKTTTVSMSVEGQRLVIRA